mgnify:CR=1 FL=1
MEPGDKLPSERMMSEKFETSRSNVREAIQKLEFYGLLKSIPQSGTFVANIGVIALNGMIDDILRLEDPDFKSLVETRILLELKTSKLAAILGVTHCLPKYPFEISGGEQQRINIIRAISLRPKLLLCDEPTGNLDSKNTEVVLNLLRSVSEQINSTLIVVTHDEKISHSFQSKITIEDGQIIS